MLSRICLALRELFPPGCLSDDDQPVDDIIRACAEEFAQITTLAETITGDTPGSGPLNQRWNAIGLRGGHPKCIEETESGSFCVSNNLAHLNTLLSGVSITASQNQIVVSGICNQTKPARSGFCYAGSSLMEISRNQEALNMIEMTKHAHVQAIYEVTCTE